MSDSSLFDDFLVPTNPSSRRSKKPFGKLILLLGVISIALVGIGLSSKYVFPQAQQPAEQKPTNSVLPASTSAEPVEKVASKAATPEVVDLKTGLSKTALSVTVQNGSGELGVGIKAADILKAAGYSVTTIGNASTFDYVDITISVKPEKEDYLVLLKQDLSLTYTISSSSATLDKNFPSDAMVIVGKEK